MILHKCCLSEIYVHSEVKMSHKGRSQSASFNFQNVHVSHPFVIDIVLHACNVVLHSSVRRGLGVLNDDKLTINVGSFVNSMAFCRITSPVLKQHPSTSVRYRRIVTHDVVIMTGHNNGRIRAWDVKTGKTVLLCFVRLFSTSKYVFKLKTFSCCEVNFCEMQTKSHCMHQAFIAIGNLYNVLSPNCQITLIWISSAMSVDL